jgi:carboxypeptidase C (cathepsin A)
VAIRTIRQHLLPVCAASCVLLLSSCGGGSSAPTTPTTTPTTPGAYADTLAYSSIATASLAAPNENAAVIAAHITLAGKEFDYTVTSGHLTATDAVTGKPSASFFYVAYTAPTSNGAARPLTFFYNGGPGSSSMWLHLGSFGPRRLVSTIPSSTIPPAQLVDNQETLLPYTDMVFVDAIGTGYSEAIAPNTNQSFWGVDSDAAAFRDFVQRYISVNQRQATAKLLYGESYGTPRTAVLANLLETAGVEISAVVLQSTILNYNTNCGVLNPGTYSCEGYVPTYAATGAYYRRSTPVPGDFSSYVQQARAFSTGDYRTAMRGYLTLKTPPPAAVVAQLVADTGIPTLTWQQNFDLGPDTFQTTLLPGQLIGRYDARVSAPAGSALTVDGDPSLTVVNDAFTSTIISYLAGELHYSAKSAYTSDNSDTINRWNFSHDGQSLPDTVPDLAAALTQHPSMQILSLNGYHDLATPFHQTELDLARLGNEPGLQFKYYASGHMIYLDDAARKLQQADLVAFYASLAATPP